MNRDCTFRINLSSCSHHPCLVLPQIVISTCLIDHGVDFSMTMTDLLLYVCGMIRHEPNWKKCMPRRIRSNICPTTRFVSHIAFSCCYFRLLNMFYEDSVFVSPIGLPACTHCFIHDGHHDGKDFQVMMYGNNSSRTNTSCHTTTFEFSLMSVATVPWKNVLSFIR